MVEPLDDKQKLKLLPCSFFLNELYLSVRLLKLTAEKS